MKKKTAFGTLTLAISTTHINAITNEIALARVINTIGNYDIDVFGRDNTIDWNGRKLDIHDWNIEWERAFGEDE